MPKAFTALHGDRIIQAAAAGFRHGGSVSYLCAGAAGPKRQMPFLAEAPLVAANVTSKGPLP
jgi:hypothetical protein